MPTFGANPAHRLFQFAFHSRYATLCIFAELTRCIDSCVPEIEPGFGRALAYEFQVFGHPRLGPYFYRLVDMLIAFILQFAIDTVILFRRLARLREAYVRLLKFDRLRYQRRILEAADRQTSCFGMGRHFDQGIVIATKSNRSTRKTSCLCTRPVIRKPSLVRGIAVAGVEATGHGIKAIRIKAVFFLPSSFRLEHAICRKRIAYRLD